MLNSIRKSKTAKGLVGLIAPLILASGIYFSNPKHSHANPVSDFVMEEIIDPIIDSVVPQLTDGKYKTYKDAIKDINPEKEQKKEPTGILYLRDGTIIKNVRYKDKEFTFTKDGQKLKIAKEKVLVIDFSKEKDKDTLYMRDGSTIKNVQYQSKNLGIQSYLGDMQIDQDKIKVLIFGKQPKTTEEKTVPKTQPKPSIETPKEGLGEKIIIERLTNHPAEDMLPTWSPDGKKIAFASKRDGNLEVYVMNADGSGIKNLTNYSGNDSGPSWSPDGKKITFASRRNGNADIYIMGADGSNVKRLTNHDADDDMPRWSPDGKKITFQSKRDGKWDIYVMNADGINVKRLTKHDTDKRLSTGSCMPSWSPDGKKITFESGIGNVEIYIMNADGSGIKNITNCSAADTNASWSHDGKKIVFQSNRDKEKDKMFNPDIYAMDADGSNVKRLTNHNAGNGQPSLSPDGKKIAFTSKKDGNMEVYVMYLDGVKSTPEKEESRPSVEIKNPILKENDVIALFRNKINENKKSYQPEYITIKHGKFTPSGDQEAVVSFWDDNQEIGAVADQKPGELWLLKYKNGRWGIDIRIAESPTRSVEVETIDVQRDGRLELWTKQTVLDHGYMWKRDELISLDGRKANVLYNHEEYENGTGMYPPNEEISVEHKTQFKDIDKDGIVEIIDTKTTKTYVGKEPRRLSSEGEPKISTKTTTTTYKLKKDKYVEISEIKDKSETSQINKGAVNELETILRLEDTIKNDKYVAVNMSCPWGPCKEYDPVFEEIAKEYGDIAFCQVIIGKAGNGEETKKIENKYKLKGMPTTILFKDGKEVYRKLDANIKTEQLKGLINEYLKKK
jgi:TolB protein